MSKSKLIKLLILPAIILVLLLAPLVLLSTQSGSQWLLRQVPGLTVEGWQGAVLTDWRAEQLHWQQDDLSVRLSDVHFQLRPTCLLRSAVCLDTLEVARLELNLPETETPAEPEQTITLPDLKLPLSIEVKRVQLGELILNGESLLSDAGLRARWLDDGIHIGEIALSYQDYALAEAALRVHLRRPGSAGQLSATGPHRPRRCGAGQPASPSSIDQTCCCLGHPALL